MNICLLTENHYKGGVDTFIINLINAWPDSLSSFTIHCNYFHPGIENLIAGIRRPVKIQTYSFPFAIRRTGQHANRKSISKSKKYLILVFKGLIFYLTLFPFYVFFQALYFRISNYNRLIVVNGGHPGSLFCQASVIGWYLSGKKVKAIYNFHSSLTKPELLLSIVQSALDFFLIQSSSQFVTVSRSCMDAFLKTSLFTTKSSKLSYIHNGIEDPYPLISDSTIEVSELFMSTPFCLMLSTLEPQKGHHFLIRVFKNVLENFPEVRLIMCGYGNPQQKQSIMDAINESGLQDSIILLDFVPKPYKLIYKAKVLLFPSQLFESFGLTIIEAMALKTPIVASDVGGIPEVLLDTDAGYVCPSQSIDIFYNRINLILSNSDLAYRLGENGREAFTTRYSASIMAKKYYSMVAAE